MLRHPTGNVIIRNKSKQREIRTFNKKIDEMDGNIYKSVLHNLSLIPEEYMAQVNNFLKSLQKRSNSKEQNRKEILDLAGSWEDMEEKDFNKFLNEAKKSGQDLFNNHVEL